MKENGPHAVNCCFQCSITIHVNRRPFSKGETWIPFDGFYLLKKHARPAQVFMENPDFCPCFALFGGLKVLIDEYMR